MEKKDAVREAWILKNDASLSDQHQVVAAKSTSCSSSRKFFAPLQTSDNCVFENSFCKSDSIMEMADEVDKGAGQEISFSIIDFDAAYLCSEKEKTNASLFPVPLWVEEKHASTPESETGVKNDVFLISGDNMQSTISDTNECPLNGAYGDGAAAVNIMNNVQENPETYTVVHDKPQQNQFELVCSGQLKGDTRVLNLSTKSSLSESSTDQNSHSMDNDKNKLKKVFRKPLAVVNNANVKPTTNSQGYKRASRMPAPRMNTAALSRIKARSPQKQTTCDENQSASLKPSSGTAGNRRLHVRKQVANDRKSIIPPLNKQKNLSHTNKTENRTNTIKRKIEAVTRDTGRPSKVDGRPGSATASARRTTAQSSKVSSRIQRSHVLSHPHSSTTEAGVITSFLPRSRANYSKLKTVSKRESNRTPQNLNLEYKNSLSVVAIATLLDYVVNRLDGLSAPKLSADKQQLQKLVDETKLSNESLSSRISGFEKIIHDSRELHELSLKRHDEEVTKMKIEHESVKRELLTRMDRIEKELSTKIREYQHSIETLKDDHNEALNDLSANHSETEAQLRLEHSKEREKWEKETEELRNNFEDKVNAKVEELIQPYINSFEENKSLKIVLEMKNAEQHKLQAELSHQNILINEAQTLRDNVIRLEQRNEDLLTQLKEKNNEQIDLKTKNEKLHRNLNEHLRTIQSKQQQIDQLDYRLQLGIPSPSSPFNPVFTTSSITSQDSTSQDFATFTHSPLRKHQKSSNDVCKSDFAPTENGAL